MGIPVVLLHLTLAILAHSDLEGLYLIKEPR